MAQAYYFSEEDLAILNQIITAAKNRPWNYLPVTSEQETVLPHPEPYLALTPAGGIAGLSGSVPGSADCRIYRRDYANGRNVLEDAGFTETVYNFSPSGIGANLFVIATRDKFGDFWVSGYFEDADNSTGTGYTPPVPPSGTATSSGSSVIFPPSPSVCADPIYIEETEVFCETWQATMTHEIHGGDLIGLGTGTGTNVPPDPQYSYLLNLYRRRVYLTISMYTGCLTKTPGPWEYIRTIGCCDTSCVEPDTGTGTIIPDNCCPDGLLDTSVDYTISGPLGPYCDTCAISGTLLLYGEMNWENTGDVGCSDQTLAKVTLYCVGSNWKAKVLIRRYIQGIYDNIQNFDIVLSTTFPTILIGSFTLSGCGTVTLIIDNPCSTGTAGTSTSTADQYVLTACSATPIKKVLHGVVTNVVGTYGCVDTAITFTYNGGQWISDHVGCGEPDNDWKIYCLTGDMVFFSTALYCGTNVVPDSVSYSPLEIVYNLVCAAPNGMGSLTLTVTE